MSNRLNTEKPKVKITPYEYNMLVESFDYIRSHRHTTNLQIPDHFLHFWAIPNFGINPHSYVQDARLLVFMYILKLHHYSGLQIENLLSSYQFTRLFYNFQIILSATQHAKHQHIPLTPFPIFDFRAYSIPDLNDPAELCRQFERITNRKIPI